MSSERDQLLAKAQERPSEEEIEARYASRLKRGQQVETLKALIASPEWRMFDQMVRDEELARWIDNLLRPDELLQGVFSTSVPMETQQGFVSQPMKMPVDGLTHAMREQFFKGVVWGVKNVLSFPERVEAAYQRAVKQEQSENELLKLAAGHSRKGPPMKNPAEGGS